MRASDKDLEEFQAVRDGEVKQSAGGEGQGPGWEPGKSGLQIVQIVFTGEL